MSIVVLGDVHGDTDSMTKVLKNILTAFQNRPLTAVIQVGDFGLFPKNEDKFRDLFRRWPLTIPFYFIDGNHDDCERWSAYDKVTRVFHDCSLFYVPRGSVLGLGGKTFAFMGGAASPDYQERILQGWFWTEKEKISDLDVKRLQCNLVGETPDYFITHTPPIDRVVSGELGSPKYRGFFDPSALIVEECWIKMKCPKLIAGHMHQSYYRDNVRVLDINEWIVID